MTRILFFVWLALSGAFLPSPVHTQLSVGVAVTSQSESIQVVNGKSHVVDTTSVVMDHRADGFGQVFTINGVNGQVSHSVTLTPLAPVVRYRRVLIGYIPRGVWSIRSTACLTNLPHNLTEEAVAYAESIGHDDSGSFLYTESTGGVSTPTGQAPIFAAESIPALASNTMRSLLAEPESDGTAAEKGGLKQYGLAGSAGLAYGFVEYSPVFKPVRNNPYGSAAMTLVLGGAVGGGPGLAFAAGTVAMKLFFGGGKSGLDAVFDALKALTANIDKFISKQVEWNARQIKVDQSILNTQRIQVGINEYLMDQTESNRIGINILQTQVRTLYNQSQSQQTAITGIYNNIRWLINATSVSDNNLYNILINEHDNIEEQFKRVNLNQQRFITVQRGITTTLLRMISRIDLKRQLISSHWANMDDAQWPVDWVATFADDEGKRPRSHAERLLLQNEDSAFTVSTTRMEYTQDDGLHGIAVELKTEYKCDRGWLLNNTDVNSDFRTLMNNLGHDNATHKCTESTPWTCTCAIVVTKRSCLLNADNRLWPWHWGIHTRTIKDNPHEVTYCTGGISEETTVGTFTNEGDWNNYITSVCMSSMLKTGFGESVRIQSDESTTYVNLDLHDKSTQGACDPDWFTSGSHSNDSDFTLAESVFRMWQHSYQAKALKILGDEESDMFGVMPSHASVTERPARRYPGAFPTFQCFEGDATVITKHPTNGKLPVYVMVPLDTTNKMDISINNGATVSTNGSFHGPWVTGGNFTLTSAITVDETVSTSLSGTFVTVGDFLNDSYYREYGEWASYTFDVPQSSLPLTRTRSTLCNTVMYMMQNEAQGNRTMSSPFNASAWEFFSGEYFKPECASDSPHLYMRTIDQRNGRYQCGPSIDPDYVGWRTVSDRFQDANHLWCDVLDSYDARREGDIFEFRPTKWTMRATFHAPAGTWVQEVQTSCPDNYTSTVSVATGTTSVVLYKKSTHTMQVKVCLSSDAQPGCSIAGSGTYQYSESMPAVIPTVAVQSNMYMQAFVIGQEEEGGCFAGKGIPIGVNNVALHPGPGISTNVKNHIDFAQDAAVLEAAALMRKLEDFRIAADRAIHQSNTTSQFEAALTANINKFNEELAGIAAANDKGQRASTESYNKFKADMEASIAEAAENSREFWKRDALLRAVANEFKMGVNTTASELDNLIETQEELEVIAKDNTKLTNDLHKAIDNLEGSVNGCGGIPIIGDIFCFLHNTLGSLWDGISSVFRIVIYVIVLILAVKFLGPICNQCRKGAFSAKKSDGGRERQQYERDVGLGTDNKSRKKRRDAMSDREMDSLLQQNS